MVLNLDTTALYLWHPPDLEVVENQLTSRESCPGNTQASVQTTRRRENITLMTLLMIALTRMGVEISTEISDSFTCIYNDHFDAQHLVIS